MAEWLRRLTRNQLGFPRVGSNPTVRDLLSKIKLKMRQKRILLNWHFHN